MNKNEESLISHALELCGMQYNDNVELRYYINKKFIEVGDCNIKVSYMLRVYNGMIHAEFYKAYRTPSKLDNNIRSFINHWMRYYKVNGKISHVAIRECHHNMFNIAILCDDNQWCFVIENPYDSIYDWSIYKW